MEDYESDYDEDDDAAFMAEQSMGAMSGGELSDGVSSPGGKTLRLKRERPGTRERQQGRVGLTVLQARPEIAASSTLRHQDNDDDDGEDDGPRRPGMGSTGASGRASPVRGGTADPNSTGRPGEEGKDANGLPLKICLGPQRPRQIITFEDRIIIDTDATRPTLTVFEHVEGSKVSDGLFPSYILPNGKRAHMYYNGGALLDEVSVEAVVPPPRPSTVPQALQQTMPLANVLNLIAKPPGSSPPFIPYKPVPRLVPLPDK